MRNLNRCPIVLFVVSSLSFGIVTEISQAAETGIDGIVSVSPARPGPLRQGESGKAPAAGVAFVVQKEKQIVASFKTDADGHFHLTLPVGHYVIFRQDAGAAVGRWQFEVDVTAGEMTKVNWTGDSGMR